VRLKLLIAYSTVAQIGYLFLMFPLAINPETGHPWSTAAWTGAFFRPSRTLRQGHVHGGRANRRGARARSDRRAYRHGRALPVTVFAFGLGGLSLMGLPPSGVRGESDVADGGGRSGSMVVGHGHPAGGLLAVATFSSCLPEHWRMRASP
jgi:NADH:ubiquinone oxidoreductase subunit 5 (subunit L)/multisubunit Na+/H+ antiporter MnhA subunit